MLKNAGRKTWWQHLFVDIQEKLLSPVGIEVLSEVQVVATPPLADLILIRRRGQSWTNEQRLLLADGMRDLEADHILAELKIT